MQAIKATGPRAVVSLRPGGDDSDVTDRPGLDAHRSARNMIARWGLPRWGISVGLEHDFGLACIPQPWLNSARNRKKRARNTMNQHKTNLINRRQFLCATSAGVVLFHILPGSAVHGTERLAANEKLNVAGIGIGGQGRNDIDAVAGEGHNMVALCDVDDKYAAKKFAQYPNARQFKDFRVMLDKMNKEIDAVVIGTPDHSHAVIAMEAMRYHKHVYCEKPLAHSVHEIRELMQAATKYKVVTQLGNQGHSFASICRLCE